MAEKLYPPVAAKILNGTDEGLISLELQDGTVYQGYSFGAKKSVAGELVFQTVRIKILEFISSQSSYRVLLWRMFHSCWIIAIPLFLFLFLFLLKQSQKNKLKANTSSSYRAWWVILSR